MLSHAIQVQIGLESLESRLCVLYIEQTQPPTMFALWDADGNEIRDEYPQMDPRDILCSPGNAVFDLDMIVGRLKEIGGSDIVALHQLAQNHYFVIIERSRMSQKFSPLRKPII